MMTHDDTMHHTSSCMCTITADTLRHMLSTQHMGSRVVLSHKRGFTSLQPASRSHAASFQSALSFNTTSEPAMQLNCSCNGWSEIKAVLHRVGFVVLQANSALCQCAAADFDNNNNDVVVAA